MKKLYLTVLPIAFFIFIAPSSALAYHDSFQNLYDWGPWYKTSKQQVLAVSTTSGELKQEATSPDILKQADVKNATGLLPDSPLYFIKSLTENIQLFFTFDSIGKMEKELAIAEERLAEVKTLLARGNYSSVGKTLDAYSTIIADTAETLATSKKSPSVIEKFAKTVEQETAKQSLFLEKVQLIADERLKEPLDQAISKSKWTMDASADVLNLDPIPADLQNRIESLNTIGVLSDAEVAALFSLDSRNQARVRIKRLVDQQVLPSSDVKRLDEAQRKHYPDDYYGIAEVKKIYELKTLLNNAPDENTNKRLAQFGSNYQTGDPIPPDLKPWWLREQRLQELQFTLRPDLVINSMIAKDTQEYKNIENIVSAFRPTVQQLQVVDTWARENPYATASAEIARIVALANNLGTPVPWTPPVSLTIPKATEQILHPYCLDSETRAKHAITGEVKVFPTACLPPNWYSYPVNNMKPFSSVPVNADVPHVATPECGYGVCKVYQCDWGWRDIDGNFHNGCEARDPFPGPSPTPIPYHTIPLGNPPIGPPGVPITDPAGNVYVNTVAPHVALPSCGFGVCKVQTCESGWYDRNDSFTDGCESQKPPPYGTPSYGTPYASPTSNTYGTPPYASPSYATPYETPYGTPGYGTPSGTVNTSAPHVAVPSCGFGVCKVQTCESGWYDKNGVFEDGCESNTR